jgi:hypothetical protein
MGSNEDKQGVLGVNRRQKFLLSVMIFLNCYSLNCHKIIIIQTCKESTFYRSNF